MKRNIVFLGLIIVVIVCIATLLIRKRRVSYGGKTIYQWLEETDRSRGRLELGWGITLFDCNKEPIERVNEAFQAMRTNAIPHLLIELTAEGRSVCGVRPQEGPDFHGRHFSFYGLTRPTV